MNSSAKVAKTYEYVIVVPIYKLEFVAVKWHKSEIRNYFKESPLS